MSRSSRSVRTSRLSSFNSLLKEVLSNPTGRLGTIEEVADTIVFLASSLAGYINAANIRVDGGSTHSIN
jgi:3-oxoacyl-[acyl-carrier protein] reductase